jgi:hypothetical protein
MKWFKSKRKRLSDEYDATHKELMKSLDIPMDTMSLEELRKHRNYVEGISDKRDSLLKSRRFLLCSNKGNYCWWGYWWFSLSLHSFALCGEFSWVNVIYVAIPVVLIVLYVRLITRNNKTQTEMFLEGI